MRSLVPVAFVLSCLSLGASLAEPKPADRAVARGEAVFRDTQEGLAPSCASCHSLLEPTVEMKKEKHLGPGASLWGSAARAGWRNVKIYANVGDAAQLCARVYQERKKGLSKKQREDLVAFLKTKGPKGAKAGSVPARKVQKKPRLLKSYPDGDKAKGQKLYERYCVGCHNDADDAVSFAIKPGRKKRAQIARTVRGYNAKRKFKPGLMSYYPTDRLTDAQLADVLAYLGK